MKKIIILAIATTLLCNACRKEADFHPYMGENSKLAYSTYTEQFDYIWKCISMGYVFWDVDNTDWEETYTTFRPRFEALDKLYDFNGYVPTKKLEELYTEMMGGMKDHHMAVCIRNMHPEPGDTIARFGVYPGEREIASRDYYYQAAYWEKFAVLNFINNMGHYYTVSVHESCTAHVPELSNAEATLHYCLIVLPDGRKIPYLWQSMAAITPFMRELGMSTEGGRAGALIDHWLKAITETPREELAGIILDNRCNRGGYQDDLDYLVGSFINSRTEIFKTRYKEGPGRLEYSPWTSYYISPNQQYHRDLTAENIPYVVLCDLNSVSMGEIEPITIKTVLPTGHTIGERTYGGTGPLQPATCINLHYGGPFGDASLKEGYHYIYTSSFETLINGENLEGIGHTPDQIILRKDCNGDLKPQLDAAIEYITNYK